MRLRIQRDALLMLTGAAQFLLAAEISFGRLHRDVPEQKLNLLQFASGEVAQAGTTTALCRMPDYAESFAR